MHNNNPINFILNVTHTCAMCIVEHDFYHSNPTHKCEKLKNSKMSAERYKNDTGKKSNNMDVPSIVMIFNLTRQPWCVFHEIQRGIHTHTDTQLHKHTHQIIYWMKKPRKPRTIFSKAINVIFIISFQLSIFLEQLYDYSLNIFWFYFLFSVKMGNSVRLIKSY